MGLLFVASAFRFLKRHHARAIQVMNRTPAPTAIPTIAPVPSVTTAAAAFAADVDADGTDEVVNEAVDEDVEDVEDGSDVEEIGLADEEDVSWPS